MLSSFDLGSAKGLPLFLGRFFFVGLDLLGFTKDRSPTDAFSEDDIVVPPRINHVIQSLSTVLCGYSSLYVKRFCAFQKTFMYILAQKLYIYKAISDLKTL